MDGISVKIDGAALVEALNKFQDWLAEMEDINAHITPHDTAYVLMRELYGTESMSRKLIGGSNAPIFMDAVKYIHELQKRISALESRYSGYEERQ